MSIKDYRWVTVNDDRRSKVCTDIQEEHLKRSQTLLAEAFDVMSDAVLAELETKRLADLWRAVLKDLDTVLDQRLKVTCSNDRCWVYTTCAMGWPDKSKCEHYQECKNGKN